MKFFQQNRAKNCQIVALQTVLSHYDLFPTQKEIAAALPKHSYGNLITELAIYIESQGIKTKLISNFAQIRKANAYFYETLERYKQRGIYQDRKVDIDDITESPALINVDWYKITGKDKGRGAHYVAYILEDSDLWLYDGSNYKKRVKKDFQQLLNASRDINRYHDDGMWLICQ